MEKAFDAVLQMEIDAATVAKTSYRGYGDKFRYQCLYCGEEVHLAAADSVVKSPHFRHRRGNNDTDCESYLGQPGAVEHYVSLRKYSQDHIEFCFNRNRMTFEIGVSFSREELIEHENNNSVMTVSSSYYMNPFLTVPLNRENFIADGKSYFTVNEFSTVYVISFDSGKARCVYADVMKTPENINIYKVKLQDEHCRQQLNHLLYTDTDYIIISESREVIEGLTAMRNVITIDDIFTFMTENRNFFGFTFSIKRADIDVLDYFQKYGYQIEVSESLGILWPPVMIKNGWVICNQDNLYLRSSFEMIPHGNVNKDVSVSTIGTDVFKIQIDDEFIVHEKNVDVCIKKDGCIRQQDDIEEPVVTFSGKYTVPNDNDYFRFDKNGCSRLKAGQTVYLSKKDRIVGYKNGHLRSFVFAPQQGAIDKQQFIDEIIKYHPQSEMFIADEFMDIDADEPILTYLEHCYHNGSINTVVRKYIKEGRI